MNEHGINQKIINIFVDKNEKEDEQQIEYKIIVHETDETNNLIAFVLPFVFHFNLSYCELSWLLVFNELNE